MSAGLSAAFFALFAYLWLRTGPMALMRASWIGFYVALFGLALPAWYYSYVGWRDTANSLVDTYPPTSAALLPLFLALIVLLRPQRMPPARLSLPSGFTFATGER